MTDRIEITPELIEQHMAAARAERALAFVALARAVVQVLRGRAAPAQRPMAGVNA